jgi:hypothetical protein
MKKSIHITTLLLLTLFMFLGSINTYAADQPEDLRVRVYPTEIHDNTFFISVESGFSDPSELDIKILNLVGGEMEYDWQVSSNGLIKITLKSTIPNGIYIVRINKNRVQTTQRILVRNG